MQADGEEFHSFVTHRANMDRVRRDGVCLTVQRRFTVGGSASRPVSLLSRRLSLFVASRRQCSFKNENMRNHSNEGQAFGDVPKSRGTRKSWSKLTNRRK